MRKPRDYDAELEALDQKARALRHRKIMQLGELVISCGADTLPIDMLAGTLLAAVETTNPATREEWRKRGAAMFQGKVERAGGGRGRPAPGNGGEPPVAGEPSAE